MALPKIKEDATLDRLNQLDMPDGAGWITEARTEAVNRVQSMGRLVRNVSGPGGAQIHGKLPLLLVSGKYVDHRLGL